MQNQINTKTTRMSFTARPVEAFRAKQDYENKGCAVDMRECYPDLNNNGGMSDKYRYEFTIHHPVSVNPVMPSRLGVAL